MINQDEVFVITEDDILKPGGKGGKPANGKAPAASAKAGKAEKARETLEETVAERPTPIPRIPRSRGGSHPALAGTLSMFLWGAGQAYNGDRQLGILFFLCQALVVSIHYFLWSAWGVIRGWAHTFFISEWEMMLYASSFDFCVILFALYNIAQAYRTAEGSPGRFEGLHRPTVAGLASVLVPGWGQMLNGQMGKASFFLFAFLLQIYVIVLFMYSPFYAVLVDLDPVGLLQKKIRLAGMGTLFATALCWLLATYDALLVARYTRRLNA